MYPRSIRHLPELLDVVPLHVFLNQLSQLLLILQRQLLPPRRLALTLALTLARCLLGLIVDLDRGPREVVELGELLLFGSFGRLFGRLGLASTAAENEEEDLNYFTSSQGFSGQRSTAAPPHPFSSLCSPTAPVLQPVFTNTQGFVWKFFMRYI